MIPLFKRYFGLFRGCITTEGIDTGSAHPQPSHEHAEESADIWSEWRGAYRSWYRLAIPPSPLPSEIHFPVISNGFTTTQGPLDFPRVTIVGMHPPPSKLFLFWEPLVLPTVDHHWGSQTSLVSSACGIDAWASDGPSSGVGMLGRGQLPTPLPCICVQASEGWLFLLVMYSLTCLPIGGRIQSMMGSSHPILAAMRWQIVAIISVLC